MTQSAFGTLVDLCLREAWPHEAHDFTPWLSQNLDRLSVALGLTLELIGAEKSLPSLDDQFSADILAREAESDRRVLIENQLARSDHAHLGQLLTYLAGLDAKIVIWIAADFRDAHLAAVKWLNKHTTEDHAFFAVRLRVVRIGNSPIAPLFSVLEQPNAWERRAHTRTREREREELTEIGERRRLFWRRYVDRFPHAREDQSQGALATKWRRATEELVVAYHVSYDQSGGRRYVGVFLRGRQGMEPAATKAILAPKAGLLTCKLEADFGRDPESRQLFWSKCEGDITDSSQFERLADWLEQRVEHYVQTVRHVFEEDV